MTQLSFNQTHSGVEPTIYTQYLYDSSGNRVKKFTRTSGGNWETLTYIDGIIEYRENDVSERQSIAFVMDDTRRVVSLREGDDFGDTTPALKYQLDDHLGSSNVLLDDGGTLVSREEYYPFGETSFGSYGKKRYRFCGKERDEESGMYYYGARYYAPWTCRFVSVDPLAGKYAQLTPYNYAGNDPIGDKDIDGMQSQSTDTSQTSTPSAANAPSPNETVGTNVNCHQVKENETLSGIAKQYGVTVDALRRANNLDSKNDRDLAIGTELNIPSKDSSNGPARVLQQKDRNARFETDAIMAREGAGTKPAGSSLPKKQPAQNSNRVKLQSQSVAITFDGKANNPVSPKLAAYFNTIMAKAAEQGIYSINISSTTNHPSNSSNSAHSSANGAKAVDINVINGEHVSRTDRASKVLQQIIKSTPGYRENYGPSIINKVEGQKVMYAPWARDIRGGHYDHVHISVR